MADTIHHRPVHHSHASEVSFDRKSSLELGGTAALPELAGPAGLVGDLRRTEALARREQMGFEDAEAGLPPVDKGLGAWLFVLHGFVIDGVIWGAGGSWGTFQVSAIIGGCRGPSLGGATADWRRTGSCTSRPTPRSTNRRSRALESLEQSRSVSSSSSPCRSCSCRGPTHISFARRCGSHSRSTSSSSWCRRGVTQCGSLFCSRE